MTTMILATSLAWAGPCTELALTEQPHRTACLADDGGSILGGDPELALPAGTTAVAAGPLGSFVVGLPGAVQVIDAVTAQVLVSHPIVGTPDRVALVDAVLAWAIDDRVFTASGGSVALDASVADLDACTVDGHPVVLTADRRAWSWRMSEARVVPVASEDARAAGCLPDRRVLVSAR